MPAPGLLLRGENRLLSRSLRLSDGVTPLLVATLQRASVEVLQAGKVRATYVLGTAPALRAGVATDELVLELTSALTLALKPGPVALRWEFRRVDAAFTVEPGGVFIDRLEETPFTLA